jgi:hypothetical protein
MKNNRKAKLWAYLVLLAVSIFKAGCGVKSSFCLCRLRKIMASCHLRELPSITALTYAALLSTVDGILAIRFGSNSYPIGVDCHASHCMANAPHLFEDLKLEAVGEVRA